jgi:Cu(I)/Ag(I) efflux system membrane fusion protein
MRLVPDEDAAPREPGKILFYRNPMRPDVTSPVPMKDEMGMDYVPVREGELSAPATPGQAAVEADPGRAQLIGVRTAPVERKVLSVTVRASARVAHDPELYAALEDYREARRSGSAAVSRSAELNLRRMGLSSEQVEAFWRGRPATELLLGGREGVWIYAQVYAYEAGLVKPGQPIEVTAAAFPGRAWTGRVAAVDAVLDADSRTLRVRARVPDPDGLLRPEMYVDASLRAPLGTALAVPREAVMDTGSRRIVFVETAPGRYAPRQPRLGREADQDVEVLDGLSEGEKVVVSGNFLIDSESKLRAALSEAGGAK